MTGSKSKRSWQQKIQQLIDERLARADFQADLSKVGTRLSIIDWIDLSSKYNLPLSAHGYIDYYLRTGKRDSGYISSPVHLITDTDRTIEPSENPKFQYQIHVAANETFSNERRGLYLQIMDESTISDIEIFLRENAELIAQKMYITRGRVHSPIRQSRFAERDDNIYTDLTIGDKSARELAEEHNITVEYVRKIYSRQKKKRDIERRGPL